MSSGSPPGGGFGGRGPGERPPGQPRYNDGRMGNEQPQWAHSQPPANRPNQQGPPPTAYMPQPMPQPRPQPPVNHIPYQQQALYAPQQIVPPFPSPPSQRPPYQQQPAAFMNPQPPPRSNSRTGMQNEQPQYPNFPPSPRPVPGPQELTTKEIQQRQYQLQMARTQMQPQRPPMSMPNGPTSPVPPTPPPKSATFAPNIPYIPPTTPPSTRPLMTAPSAESAPIVGLERQVLQQQHQQRQERERQQQQQQHLQHQQRPVRLQLHNGPQSSHLDGSRPRVSPASISPNNLRTPNAVLPYQSVPQPQAVQQTQLPQTAMLYSSEQSTHQQKDKSARQQPQRNVQQPVIKAAQTIISSLGRNRGAKSGLQSQQSSDPLIHGTPIPMASLTSSSSPTSSTTLNSVGTPYPIPKNRQSYQVRALARKAIAYQRRQWFTNICCVGICPMLMVFVASLVGTLVATLISNLSSASDVLYCSKEISINEQNWPIFNLQALGITNTSAGVVPGTTRTTAHANFYDLTRLSFVDQDVTQFNKLQGGRQAFPNIPCVAWFGEAYPRSDVDPYARTQHKVRNAYSNKDSAYTSEVGSGWLDIFAPENIAQKPELAQAISLAGQFSQYQTRPWALVGMDAAVSAADVGTAPAKPILTRLTDIPDKIGGGPTMPMFKPGAESNGLLDTIEPRFFVDVNIAALSIASIEQVPFFEVSAPGGSSRDLDQKLGAALRTAIKRLAQVDKSAILGGSRSTEAQIAFLSDVNAAIKDLPYGTIYFNKLNHATKDYTITLGFGLDARLDNTPSFPPAGRRQSIQLSQLTNAILRKSSAANSQSVITQGLRLFPEIKSGGVQIQISGPIGRILYPFGLSFLLPIFTIILVREKEDRILMMMRMNGLKPGVYALSQFITFYILYLISATLFVVAGYIVRLDVFVRTDIAVLVLVLVVWGLAQVAMAFFFASFLNKSSNALLIAFLVVLCGIIISLAMNQILVEPLPIIFLWPPFAFYRILTLVNEASFLSTQRPYTFGQLRPGDEVFTAIISMLGMAVLLFAIASYVDGVAPGEFGVKRRWHWPISQFFASSRKAPAAGTTKTKGKSGKGVALDKTDTWDSEELNSQDYDPMEDADVRIERHRVLSGSYDPSTHPLVIKSIHKSYPPRHGMKAPKVAVRDITLALETSQVFGLLGPNGAGKTSLLSLLTGLYAPTSGTATVAGQDIRTDIDGVYRSIGVCPQFDLLWSDLTVSDHLYFYARLKGIPPKDEAKAVLAAMEQVKLAPFADRQVVGLSGGERRRLSIAIALVGSPALVFLDEPTTGLDPEVRRLIWDIIDSARRAGRTIVLTTHSMEEAEVCCQRIGIMCKGSLRCVGPQLRLKQVYGSGFKMHATAKTLKDVRRVRRFVEKQVMPAACALMPTPTPGNGTLTPYSNKSSYFPPYYPTTAPSSLAPTSPGSGHHHHLPSTTPNSAWTVETLPHPADSKKPWRRLDAFNTTLIYTFNPTPQDFYLDPNDVPNVDPGSVASVFENMNHQMGLSARNDPSAIGLEDWGVTQSGLDDVFLKVIVGDKEDTDDLDEEADGAGAS